MSTRNAFNLSGLMPPSNREKAAPPAAPVPSEVPEARPAPAQVREFVGGAQTHSLPQGERYPGWKSYDPNERPTRGINVKFNYYELGLLEALARAEDRSVAKVIKRLLIPAAEESWRSKR